jgi:superfamily II DNA or RNA helicase
MDLRCYQSEAVNAVHARFAAGKRAPLVVLPTGSGKTIVAAHIAKEQMNHGRIMVLTHREELLQQAADKFEDVTGYKCAIERADEKSDEHNIYGKPPIVVSSVQSQISGRGGLKRMHRFLPREFSLVWVDEAHHAVAGSWQKVIAHYMENANCKLLGVTATPDRADEEALGSVFDCVAYELSLPEIIRRGYLVPIEQRAVVIEGLDFAKIRTLGGDLNQGDLEQAMMDEEPLHGIAHATIEVSNGLSVGALNALRDDPDRAAKVVKMIDTEVSFGEAKRRKTLMFCVSVSHAERMAEIVCRWLGVNVATHVDGTMTREERSRRLSAFANGECQYLMNCMVATEGYDCPGVELVVMARPTKSRALYSQMAGRGTRPAESIARILGTLATPEERRALIASSEKPGVEILDFVGNCGRHKLVTTVDILGKGCSEDVLAMVREKMQQQALNVMDAIEESKEEIERKRREAEEKRRKIEEEKEKRRQAEAAKRAGLVGTAQYQLEQVDGFSMARPSLCTGANGERLHPKHVNILVKGKVPPEDIAKLTPEQAKRLSQEIVRRWKLKLCSYKQAKLLQRCGWSKAETFNMPYEVASVCIEHLKANGWKRNAERRAVAA